MRLAGVLVVALVTALAVGQAAPPAPQYENPTEVAALDGLLPTGVDQSTSPPQDLVELSRLLSSPCDQLRWLLAQVQTLSKLPTRDYATQLNEAATERGQTLERGGHLRSCADLLAALSRAIPTEVSLLDISNPAALRDRLKQEKDPAGLGPDVKFALLARGVPEAQLFKQGASEPWDMPRQVVGRLADEPNLPGFKTLRESRGRLNTVYTGWQAAGFQPFGEPAQQAAVRASFQIAAALLDRALGLDDKDVEGLTGGVVYPTDAAGWTQLAEELEVRKLPIWSVTARLLATGGGGAVDAAALQQTWADVQTLAPGMWTAVGDAKDGWLARLSVADRRNAPHRLPLGSDFRAAARQQRQKYEREVLRLIQGLRDPADAGVADQVFQAIQRAKAADLDLAAEATPLTIERVKDLFSDKVNNDVYLFVEMLELREVDAEPGKRFCGVALYRKEYTGRMKNVAYTDRYVEKTLLLSASPVELVKVALGQPPDDGPPTNTAEARFLLAPDGPPPATWFGFEHERLLPLAKTGESWIVYMPSALAMERNWTLEDTLRVWYRLALRGGGTLLDLELGAGELGTCPLKTTTQISGMTIKCLWAGKSGAASSQLAGFMRDKRENNKISALPLWVRN
jgi:hypothetical protein